MGKKLRTEVEIEKICEYNGHKGSIFALALSDDEQWLFSSGDDGIVVKWSLEKGKDDGEGVLRIAGSIYALSHLMPWNILVAGSSTGSLYFIDLNTNKILHQYARSTDPIYQLAFYAKTATLYALHGSGYLSEISIPDFTEKRFRRLSENHLRSMAIMEDTGQLFIGNSNHQIMALQAETGEILHHWQAHDNSVFGLMHVPDSSLLISGGRDAHMNIWDLKKEYQLVQSIPAHNYTLNDFALAPDGDYFATASRDKTIKIWDSHSFELKKVVDFARNMAHTHSVNRIFWLKSDNSLISCSDDRRIIRWRIAFLSQEV